MSQKFILKCNSGKELFACPATALDVLANVRRIYQNDSEVKAVSKLVVGNCHQENPKPTHAFMSVLIYNNALILGTGIDWAVSHSKTVPQNAQNGV